MKGRILIWMLLGAVLMGTYGQSLQANERDNWATPVSCDSYEACRYCPCTTTVARASEPRRPVRTVLRATAKRTGRIVTFCRSGK